ncbi:MAG: M23 family metallopeptidase [Elusimicrobiota bacterium]
MKKSGYSRVFCAALALVLITAAGLSAAGAKGKKQKQRGWEHYKRRANILKKHHGRNNLDDKGILKILESAGVLGPDSSDSQGGHKSFAKGFQPFKVRKYLGIWTWPLRYGIVSSEYGPRWGKEHKGLDIAADEGDKIYASAPGEVLYSSASVKGYGKLVILRHDEQTTSLYAHNSELFVKKGQHVRTGQVIAAVGSTGRSTGPHIHFEIRRRSSSVDPRQLLPRGRF